MGRRPRIHTQPDALVEVVHRTFQGRFLIKPGPLMNAMIVGALAKAKEEHGVKVYGGAFLSGHLHLLISAPSVKAQADFMRDFTRKLSIESGRLYNWKGSTFPDRYHATEISDEPEAQAARLAYCLRHGTKENLVASPLDWPGVPFVEALMSGEPLAGVWIDRTGFHRARNQGECVALEDFMEPLDLRLDPLPCVQSLSHKERRAWILGMVRDIEQETAARHRAEGTAPIGVDAVLAADPHSGPASFEPSPQPLFHAFSKITRHEMKEALAFILSAYRDASKQLKKGNLSVSFPENTFPSALPFVEPGRAALAPDPAHLQPG